MQIESILTTEGIIWKILATQQGSHLIFEIRYAQDLKVELVAIDVLNNRMFAFDTKSLPNWYINLWVAKGSSFWVHTYKNGAYSTPLGLWRFDIGKRSTPTIVSATCIPDGSNSLGKVTYYQNGRQEADAAHSFHLKEDNQVLYPIFFTQEHQSYAGLVRFILQKSSQTLVGICDYLETDNFIILSGTVSDENSKLNHMLWIYSVLSGEELYKLCIIENAALSAGGSFFVWSKNLYTVSNKNTCLKIKLY